MAWQKKGEARTSPKGHGNCGETPQPSQVALAPGQF